MPKLSPLNRNRRVKCHGIHFHTSSSSTPSGAGAISGQDYRKYLGREELRKVFKKSDAIENAAIENAAIENAAMGIFTLGAFIIIGNILLYGLITFIVFHFLSRVW